MNIRVANVVTWELRRILLKLNKLQKPFEEKNCAKILNLSLNYIYPSVLRREHSSPSLMLNIFVCIITVIYESVLYVQKEDIVIEERCNIMGYLMMSF